MSEIKLIVGLGNPGSKYDLTRHNIGFQTIDLLADENNVHWKNWNGVAEVSDPLGGSGPRLVKPQTYMNNSGQAVNGLAQYYKISPQEIFVVFDDFSLPLGEARLRKSGSAGGHNGVSSIIQHMGTSEFPRLKLGIGPVPPMMDPADFVLGRFASAERDTVRSMVELAVQTMKDVLSIGFDKAATALSARMPKE